MNSLSHIAAAGGPVAGQGTAAEAAARGEPGARGRGRRRGARRRRAGRRERPSAAATVGAGERKFARGHRAQQRRFRPAEKKQEVLHFRFTPREGPPLTSASVSPGRNPGLRTPPLPPAARGLCAQAQWPGWPELGRGVSGSGRVGGARRGGARRAWRAFCTAGTGKVRTKSVGRPLVHLKISRGVSFPLLRPFFLPSYLLPSPPAPFSSFLPFLSLKTLEKLHTQKLYKCKLYQIGLLCLMASN